MNILSIISKTGYQNIEFNIPKKILENAGYKIQVASTEKGICFSGDGSESYNAEYSINEIDPEKFDGTIFVGGPGTYDDFIGNEKYYDIARRSKIIGAICIAPTIVSYSGIFKGKKITGWDRGGEQIEEMKKNGAIYTGKNVEIDGNIVTANGPQAAKEFGNKLLEILKNDKKT